MMPTIGQGPLGQIALLFGFWTFVAGQCLRAARAPAGESGASVLKNGRLIGRALHGGQLVFLVWFGWQLGWWPAVALYGLGFVVALVLGAILLMAGKPPGFGAGVGCMIIPLVVYMLVRSVLILAASSQATS